jgi:hypothetical protein
MSHKGGKITNMQNAPKAQPISINGVSKAGPYLCKTLDLNPCQPEDAAIALQNQLNEMAATGYTWTHTAIRLDPITHIITYRKANAA